MADSREAIQQELDGWYEEGFRLKSKARGLSDELSKLKTAVHETEQRIDDVKGDMKLVEQHKTALTHSLCAVSTSEAAAAGPAHFPPQVSQQGPAQGFHPTNGGQSEAIAVSTKVAAAPLAANTFKFAPQVLGRQGSPSMLSAAYPVVVGLGRTWYEIWCVTCKANASVHKGSFFSGVGGLQRHMIRSHIKDGRKLSVKDVMATCGRRALSVEDVNLIMRGRDPKIKIELTFEEGPEIEDASMLNDPDEWMLNDGEEDGAAYSDNGQGDKEPLRANNTMDSGSFGQASGALKAADATETSSGSMLAGMMRKRLSEAGDETSGLAGRSSRLCKRPRMSTDEASAASGFGDDEDDEEYKHY
ncbi:hypothetical protein LTR36_010071 [Oleoguttula mirabilis]|uniref:BED-type domain-containing protein n=1 Tax=Oleoguttula mirabilis TaxID=1507867 RepID=A0AAV9JRQ3_9PEZI|nr:hypothetical protein LTR36_010071 [Oleoguttula mirabilis]